MALVLCLIEPHVIPNNRWCARAAPEREEAAPLLALQSATKDSEATRAPECFACPQQRRLPARSCFRTAMRLTAKGTVNRFRTVYAAVVLRRRFEDFLDFLSVQVRMLAGCGLSHE